ncbi:MAG: pseudouridine synthase [Candidatus Fimousia sp.]|uniref:pseudouridine synthase n=1 Tax=Anaerostipes sp. 992a TaxID=1261637 RepID=UPI0009521802|nr:pseudouridine synthase [Anaerostipes sp. 992a]OLR63659.1 23S rRNA pseudouridine synthase F [Anaerostipes sp. 992a]
MKKKFTFETIRLNKYMSDAGICSRRQADIFIQDGLVTVDGKVAVPGMKVTKNQDVRFQGKPVELIEELELIAFNKPRGIVCTAQKREKDNIIDFINYHTKIYPIGRLDKDSEGLILLTNDGEISNRIQKARYYHEKEYIVTVDKPVTIEFLYGMRNGVPILNTVTRKCRVRKLSKNQFSIILTQGLNRQIRRMCEYFGYRVLNLKRVRIMDIELGKLKTGTYRKLTKNEINKLKKELFNEPDN